MSGGVGINRNDLDTNTHTRPLHKKYWTGLYRLLAASTILDLLARSERSH